MNLTYISQTRQIKGNGAIASVTICSHKQGMDDFVEKLYTSPFKSISMLLSLGINL